MKIAPPDTPAQVSKIFVFSSETLQNLFKYRLPPYYFAVLLTNVLPISTYSPYDNKIADPVPAKLF